MSAVPDTQNVEVVVSIEEGGWEDDLPDAEPLVLRAAHAALARAEGVPRGPAELSVVLADDETVRALNSQYRGKDKPTNVLSFPLHEEEDEVLESLAPGAPLPILLGDVILAHGTVVRESSEQGKPLGDHLTHLVVHGVFHLLGYDHIADDEAERMERLETETLAGLGIPDPYAGRATAPDEDTDDPGSVPGSPHPPPA
ncbi:MAG TPA: rRNA maturation RNase YbeY [Azospirillaceae bacterium]|nr:rRNA maturation RNase YbeY [Azospirillaceae bacterium]